MRFHAHIQPSGQGDLPLEEDQFLLGTCRLGTKDVGDERLGNTMIIQVPLEQLVEVSMGAAGWTLPPMHRLLPEENEAAESVLL
jgi:hypothetical protein